MSTYISFFFIIFLGYFTLQTVFHSISCYQGKKVSVFRERYAIQISELTLICIAVSCLVYKIFYFFAPWIWSLQTYYHLQDYTFSAAMTMDGAADGAEGPFMYAMMLLNLAIMFVAIFFISQIREYYPRSYISLLILFFLIDAYFFCSIGFSPPFPSLSLTGALVFPIVMTLMSVISYITYQKYSVLMRWALVVLIAFSSLIPVNPPSLNDAAVMIAPALQLWHGMSIANIYFQYDVFLSLLVLACMKMQLSLAFYLYLGQFSCFVFFLLSFFFAERFFKLKALSVVFIIALVLVRFYCYLQPVGVPSILASLPLRLDWWIVPLFFVFKKGLKHWSVGLCLGMLILLHRMFGLLYLIAYLELLVFLYLNDWIICYKNKTYSRYVFYILLKKHISMYANNLLIILFFMVLCYLLFGSFIPESGRLFAKTGVGFTRITATSFYWYVPAMLSVLAGLVFLYQKKLEQRYTTVVYYLIFLVVVESMYFYGRSHEANVLNISGILILLLFTLFDVVIALLPQKNSLMINFRGKNLSVSFISKRSIPLFIGFSLIFLVCYFYEFRISEKIKLQYDKICEYGLKKPLFLYEMPNFSAAIDTVQRVTHGSSKVFFLTFGTDAYYYYYGNYKPTGFYSTLVVALLRKDLSDFLQNLLDQGYYLVFPEGENVDFFKKEYLQYLDYNRVNSLNGWTAVSQSLSIQTISGTEKNHYNTLHISETWSQGFYALERRKPEDAYSWRWAESQAKLLLTNYSHVPINAELQFSLYTGWPEPHLISITEKSNLRTFDVTAQGKEIRLPITLFPGKNIIVFSTNSPKINAKNDARSRHFRLDDFRINYIY